MAIKIQQILATTQHDSVLFGSWLSRQGLDARGQYSYMKSGWLDRISKGVYKILKKLFKQNPLKLKEEAEKLKNVFLLG